MDARCTLGCVVMASGAGRRFGGGNKLLADIAGLPLVVRSAASVPQALFETVVSTRWKEVADLCERHGVACVLHEGGERSESVRAGLERAAARAWDACLFLPGDQPLVGAESFHALARGYESNPGCIHRLSWQGRPASPVLFPARLFGRLSALEGSQGGRAVVAGQRCIVLHEAAHDWELWDVDTAADASRIRDLLKGSAEKK